MEAKSLLNEAKAKIEERGESYGPYRATYERAAIIANTTIGTQLSAYDVMMILHCVKLARIAGPGDQVDNYLDGVNYLAFAYEEKFGTAAGVVGAKDDTVTVSGLYSATSIIDDGIAEFARKFAPITAVSPSRETE